MSKFVDAIVRATGKRQSIPAHWLDHPVLGVPFAGLIPHPVADDVAAAFADDAPENEPDPTPDPAPGKPSRKAKESTEAQPAQTAQNTEEI